MSERSSTIHNTKPWNDYQLTIKGATTLGYNPIEAAMTYVYVNTVLIDVTQYLH